MYNYVTFFLSVLSISNSGQGKAGKIVTLWIEKKHEPGEI